jgi:class 3 adenylate cyclase
MMAVCSTCGTEPLENARFCHGCGSPIGQSEAAAEYKQVTVLFADVVHSMDIAAAVGAERLREIMTDLVKHATVIVQRYRGTWTSSPATESWPSSEHRWRWRTMPFVHALPRSTFRSRRRGWRATSMPGTVSTWLSAWA